MPVVLQLFLLQQKTEAHRLFHVQSDKVGSKGRVFLSLLFQLCNDLFVLFRSPLYVADSGVGSDFAMDEDDEDIY